MFSLSSYAIHALLVAILRISFAVPSLAIVFEVRIVLVQFVHRNYFQSKIIFNVLKKLSVYQKQVQGTVNPSHFFKNFPTKLILKTALCNQTQDALGLRMGSWMEVTLFSSDDQLLDLKILSIHDKVLL